MRHDQIHFMTYNVLGLTICVKKFNKQHTCFLHRISVSLSVRYTDNKGRCWRIAGFIFSRFVLFIFNFLFVWFFLSARGFFWLVVIVYMDFFLHNLLFLSILRNVSGQIIYIQKNLKRKLYLK